MPDDFTTPVDDDGLTLGPEEALEREIAKSKAMKVEKLKLRNQIEQLQIQVEHLEKENSILQKANANYPKASTPEKFNTPPPNASRYIPASWAYSLLIFNLAAIGILLIYLQTQ